jgi:hypothetical protein
MDAPALIAPKECAKDTTTKSGDGDQKTGSGSSLKPALQIESEEKRPSIAKKPMRTTKAAGISRM